MKSHLPLHVALLALLSACQDDAVEGLQPALADQGAAVVVFDPEAKPLPEIPLPNDLATRLDPDEPVTGRRINVSLEAPTLMEREIRRKAALANGFGTYMPITVSFTAPLDIENVVTRHQRNVDFKDDAVYVVDVTSGSPTFGQPVLLDLGQGNFPLTLKKTDIYFENDPRGMSSNVLFETEEEDINGNGRLDPGEDTDHDGMLDHPNTWPEDGRPEDALLTWYEKETNTLILRPVVPLRQETTYAVVLTRRLVGEDGKPVASPFAGINHVSQNAALEPLADVLAKNKWGLSLPDVAFAWTFTTQSVTRELEALRNGIMGKGIFSWLAEQFPVDDVVLRKIKAEGQPAFIVDVDVVAPFLTQIAGAAVDDPQATDALLKATLNVDYVVFGQYRTPFFLEDKDGIATPDYPADEDESFEVDMATGRAVVGERMVPFFCAIPKSAKKCANNQAPVCGKRHVCKDGECKDHEVCRCEPFPVVLYVHGYGGLKLEALGFAGRMAAFGFATCSIDAHGHGVDVTQISITTSEGEQFKVSDILEIVLPGLDMPGMMGALSDNRARDLNNDGEVEPAGDFWTYDVYHTRDVVRQTVLDLVQFRRVLASFDGERTLPYDVDGDAAVDLAGDFDGDGHVDLGGTSVKYFVWGQSMGGIITPILAAVEPAFEGAVPVAGGSGLFDLGMRSTNVGVPEAVFLPLFGPFVIGVPDEDAADTVFSLLVNDTYLKKDIPFYRTKLSPGDKVVLRNLVNGEEDWAVVDALGRFRVAVPADTLTASERRIVLGIDETASNSPVPTYDTTKLGDALELEIYSGPTEMLRERVSQFGQDVTFQGAIYKAGSPLVSLSTGLGMKRGTPKLRRFMGFAAMLIEPGDPVGYTPHLLADFLPAGKEEESALVHPGAYTLVLPTTGDTDVPVTTEIATARTAGIIEVLEPDKDYCVTDAMCEKAGKDGKKSPVCDFVGQCLTENQVLTNHYVAEGLSRLRRFATPPWNDDREILFDLDDLDEGKLPWPICTGEGFDMKCTEDSPDAPDLRAWGWKPLRATAPDHGSYGMRMLFAYRSDNHGFDPSTPQYPVDMNTYYVNLIGNFFYHIARGQPSTAEDPWILDDLCLADNSCKQFP